MNWTDWGDDKEEDNEDAEEEDNEDDDLAYAMCMSDSDDDDSNQLDDNLLKILLIYTTLLQQEERSKRSPVRDRLVWADHAAKLEQEGAFTRMYRMTLASFKKLCNVLHPLLLVDPVMSRISTNQPEIGTEIIVSSFIRWVSGGSTHSDKSARIFFSTSTIDLML